MPVSLTALLAATTLYAAEKTEKEKANKQTVTLIGEVYDSFTKGKVKAFVTLMDTDSTVVDTVTCETMDTRTWSYFTIKVPREAPVSPQKQGRGDFFAANVPLSHLFLVPLHPH